MTDMSETWSQEFTPELDVAEARSAYAHMTTDELLFLVASGAKGYEDGVLEVVLDELQTRGVDRPVVDENIRDLKARKYDELIAAKEARATERLSRWMSFLLLLDPTGLTVWILVYLAITKRSLAFRQGIVSVGFGWVVKLATVFVVLQFLK